MKKIIAVAIASSLMAGCASYKPNVESSVTEMQRGVFMVDTRSDSTKVTRGEALQSNQFEVAKYIRENYPSEKCFTMSQPTVDVAYNQYVITTNAQIAQCSANTFEVDTVIKSVSKLHAKMEERFKAEQRKETLRGILAGAAIVGAGVAAANY